MTGRSPIARTQIARPLGELSRSWPAATPDSTASSSRCAARRPGTASATLHPALRRVRSAHPDLGQRLPDDRPGAGQTPTTRAETPPTPDPAAARTRLPCRRGAQPAPDLRRHRRLPRRHPARAGRGPTPLCTGVGRLGRRAEPIQELEKYATDEYRTSLVPPGEGTLEPDSGCSDGDRDTARAAAGAARPQRVCQSRIAARDGGAIGRRPTRRGGPQGSDHGLRTHRRSTP